jgi:two-component system sensor histidine kinase KdpD
MLDALADQVAVSLERALLADEMHEAEMLAQNETLRTALLTSISHDLRTPLASILGNVSSLRRYGHLYDDATRSEMLTLVEEEALRLRRFVDNLLDMTRIDAGALQQKAEDVDVADLVGAALKRAEPLTAEHRIDVDLEPDLPMIRVDFVLAEHVFVNLLDNAAKYSPPGTEIYVSAFAEDGDITITVADRGPGIAEADVDRVFERFFRASTTYRRPAGAGLGLAICKGFVEAMGGRVSAGNAIDGGAILSVTLPKSRSGV